MSIDLKFMSICLKKAGCLMILIKHVISIPLSHTQRIPPVIPDKITPFCHSRRS